MAVYQDLLDTIARVRAGTGDTDAWMRGLSGADLAVAANLVAVRTPGALDGVLVKIRAAHPDLFGLPSAAAEVPQGSGTESPGGGQGAAAEAIRAAEAALAQQKSATAQLDLQVIVAVLNAHTSDATAGAALDGLQRDIEAAVVARPDLDTPAGARAFQRYLLGRLRDIRTVVQTADLDATSKAALAAALASLYAAPHTDETEQPAADRAGPAAQSTAAPPAAGDFSPAPADDALLDELLGPDPGPAAGPPPVAGAPAPTIPAVPPVPGLGAGGVPSPGAPLGGWAPTAPAGLPLPNGPGLGSGEGPLSGVADTLEAPDETAADTPEEASADDTGHPDDDAAEPAEEQDNIVRLPGGETVTAGSPELAAAITAAVAGTPIAEAFAQQGITIPPPGSPVAEPVGWPPGTSGSSPTTMRWRSGTARHWWTTGSNLSRASPDRSS